MIAIIFSSEKTEHILIYEKNISAVTNLYYSIYRNILSHVKGHRARLSIHLFHTNMIAYDVILLIFRFKMVCMDVQNTSRLFQQSLFVDD